MVRTILKETVFDKKAKMNRTNNAEFATKTKRSMVQAEDEAEIKETAISVKDFNQDLVKEDKIYKTTEPTIEVVTPLRKFNIEEITIGEV